MSENRAPWHVWAIGVISLGWNSMGVFDFLMTQSKNEAYLSNFTQEQLDFFLGFPLWLNIAWGIAVFGAMVGSILLLLRSQFAVSMFALSLLGMIATTIYSYAFKNGFEITGTAGAIFSAVIFLIAVGLTVYTWQLKRKRVLI